jgi:pimeloyl-ACP methyl ester carboxylesterase
MMIKKIMKPKPVFPRLYFFGNNAFLNVSKFSKALLVLVILIGVSCNDEDSAPKRVVLVDASKILSRTASELKVLLGSAGLDVDLNQLQYDVDLYKVTYKTTFKGSEITASGIVVLPQTTDEMGMVSFQHGTIVTQAAAPTSAPLNDTALILYSGLSSTGFITVVPDFIGFGESKVFFHPYYVEEATATAIIDNLKAAKELAAEKKVKFNKRLFLAGYSQGGYATMATHKTLEANPISGFELIASFPASGGYDVKGMQEYFFAQQTYDQPYYMAYVALSYKSYYGWNESLLGQFFQEPYGSAIPGLFNGINDSGYINSHLITAIPSLVQPNLLANIDTDDDYKFLVDAFEENSLLDWKPTIKMFMYHGDADVTVPYQNSVDTYNYFISQGVSTNVVSLKTLPGATHGTGVYPYIEDFIDKLLVLK